MSTKYRAIASGTDSSSLIRRSSEPNINSQYQDFTLSREYTSSLPQYGRLHSFLQRLSTRRSFKKDKAKSKEKTPSLDDDSEQWPAALVSGRRLAAAAAAGSGTSGKNCKYRRLKAEGRVMSENCLLTHSTI